MEDERNLIKLFELAKKAKKDKQERKRFMRLNFGHDILIGSVNENMRLNLIQK